MRINSSSNPAFSPLTNVNSEIEDPEYLKSFDNQPMILMIPTNFQKSLNKEFKPGRRVSHEDLIIATEVEQNIADAAVIPCDLVDFIEKVASVYLFI